jgi:DNA-binding response OmpR family regulator
VPEKTILIVDDDEALVRALAIKLRDCGYKVLAAWDGSQALEQARRHEPDLILLDIRMPAGGGFGVLDKLGHAVKTMDIPVIVMTALESEEIRNRARSSGAAGFFKKPFNTGRLVQAIDAVLATDSTE